MSGSSLVWYSMNRIIWQKKILKNLLLFYLYLSLSLFMWLFYFRYLIYKGGNVNIASNVDRKTALHVCSQYIYVESVVEELIAILVDSGANMNATCYQGSPLLYSIVVGKSGNCYLLDQLRKVWFCVTNQVFVAACPAISMCVLHLHWDFESICSFTFHSFYFRKPIRR